MDPVEKHALIQNLQCNMNKKTPFINYFREYKRPQMISVNTKGSTCNIFYSGSMIFLGMHSPVNTIDQMQTLLKRDIHYHGLVSITYVGQLSKTICKQGFYILSNRLQQIPFVSYHPEIYNAIVIYPPPCRNVSITITTKFKCIFSGIKTTATMYSACLFLSQLLHK
jgi:TATA-box binding protein (TBP) (component of TFIID and TFIIIB)